MEDGFDVFTIEWGESKIPDTMKPGETVTASVSVRNIGTRAIPSKYLSISYHWLEAADTSRIAVYDGLRNYVKKDIPGGGSYDAQIRIQAPDKPGKYVLVVDLVRDWFAWFGAKGAPTIRKAVQVG